MNAFPPLAAGWILGLTPQQESPAAPQTLETSLDSAQFAPDLEWQTVSLKACVIAKAAVPPAREGSLEPGHPSRNRHCLAQGLATQDENCIPPSWLLRAWFAELGRQPENPAVDCGVTPASNASAGSDMLRLTVCLC